MGFRVTPPDATFYIWVNCISPHTGAKTHAVVSHLPEKIHSGLSFFEACLEEKVIIVPGLFPVTILADTDLFV
jgi:aspartate/methionine/tyrosine aminotransferase